jgi:hypothetical protein
MRTSGHLVKANVPLAYPHSKWPAHAHDVGHSCKHQNRAEIKDVKVKNQRRQDGRKGYSQCMGGKSSADDPQKCVQDGDKNAPTVQRPDRQKVEDKHHEIYHKEMPSERPEACRIPERVAGEKKDKPEQKVHGRSARCDRELLAPSISLGHQGKAAERPNDDASGGDADDSCCGHVAEFMQEDQRNNANDISAGPNG